MRSFLNAQMTNVIRDRQIVNVAGMQKLRDQDLLPCKSRACSTGGGGDTRRESPTAAATIATQGHWPVREHAPTGLVSTS